MFVDDAHDAVDRLGTHPFTAEYRVSRLAFVRHERIDGKACRACFVIRKLTLLRFERTICCRAEPVRRDTCHGIGMGAHTGERTDFIGRIRPRVFVVAEYHAFLFLLRKKSFQVADGVTLHLDGHLVEDFLRKLGCNVHRVTTADREREEKDEEHQ